MSTNSKKLITCITLSKEPFTRDDLPEGFEYLNYVSDFKNSLTNLHAAWLSAASKVQTEGFIFVDSDDPFPVGVRMPKQDIGILIGNEITFNFLHDKTRYEVDDYVNRPTAIHKAVCRTSIAQKIIPYIPNGHYLTEWMVYSAIIKLSGFEHDPSFVYTWKKVIGKGMHTRTGGCYNPSKSWLDTQMPAMLRQLSY